MSAPLPGSAIEGVTVSPMPLPRVSPTAAPEGRPDLPIGKPIPPELYTPDVQPGYGAADPGWSGRSAAQPVKEGDSR